MMEPTTRIQLMDTFQIFVGETISENFAKRSPKGANLLAFLIINHGAAVPNQKLFNALWDDENITNPESSLKTLVSRVRSQLNELSPGLGKAVIADRGAYRWHTPDDAVVDYEEIISIIAQIKGKQLNEDEHIALTMQLVKLYKGDLIQNVPQNEWAVSAATSLHAEYLNAVYACVDLLKDRGDYETIVTICRCALDVDAFDDRLHVDLMTALVEKGRTAEALVQYKHAVQMNYRYLGIEPGADLQEFYNKIVSGEKALDCNLESIRRELRESNEMRGAFVCDYNVFKEIYNLQVRNLERLGSTMFLGLIMIGTPDDAVTATMMQENMINGLVEICRTNLRKGDTITHISNNLVAMLLPSVNFTTGNMVMERMRRLFYQKFPNTNIAFQFHIGPLTGEPQLKGSAIETTGTLQETPEGSR